MEFRKRVDITKIDEERHVVWGWAYVLEEFGKQVQDHSGEFVDDPDEIQKAAHGFVKDSRVGGVMHEEAGGEIVDSLFFSKEIQAALGIDLQKVGWFIGYEIHDDEIWKRVLSGELSAFSIAGSAQAEEI